MLKAKKAKLFDKRWKLIGEHIAGPTSRLKNGSEVTSKAVPKHDAPKAGAIPWLGMLEKVTTIQRLNTEGGVADATKVCDVSKNGAESESTHSSDYYFYAEEVTARAAPKNYS